METDDMSRDTRDDSKVTPVKILILDTLGTQINKQFAINTRNRTRVHRGPHYYANISYHVHWG